MGKNNFKLSPADKVSIIIATIALISAMFTTYIQFFYETTDLRIGDIDFKASKDSVGQKVNINILLLNTGTNSTAIIDWYSFLSKDGSLTNGTCYNNEINTLNSNLYTYGCRSDINEIIQPNSVKFIDLYLEITHEKLEQFIAEHSQNEAPFLNLGLRVNFADSDGELVSKEILIGDIQFNETGAITAQYTKDPGDLIIY